MFGCYSFLLCLLILGVLSATRALVSPRCLKTIHKGTAVPKHLLRLSQDDCEESSREGNFAASDVGMQSTFGQLKRRDWLREMEEWKQFGVKARRERRDRSKKLMFQEKAEKLAKNHLLQRRAHSEKKNAVLSRAQLAKATKVYQRLLEELDSMEQQAYQQGKERAIQRQADVVNGVSTNMEEYLKDLEVAREVAQERRELLQQQVFELPNNWRTLEDIELRTILSIRGNVRNPSQFKKRETIERYIVESFSRPLF